MHMSLKQSQITKKFDEVLCVEKDLNRAHISKYVELHYCFIVLTITNVVIVAVA